MYLGWGHIVRHVHDSVGIASEALDLGHHRGLDSRVPHLVRLLVQENPPGGGAGVESSRGGASDRGPPEGTGHLGLLVQENPPGGGHGGGEQQRRGEALRQRQGKAASCPPPEGMGHLGCRPAPAQGWLRVTFSPFLHFPLTATAKSLQSCSTLCDPIDGSPPGSPIPGILQARTLEWVAISFSNA